MFFICLIFFFSFVIIAWGRCTRGAAFTQNPVSCFDLFRCSPDVGSLSSSFTVHIYTTYAPSKDREGIDRCTHY